MPAPGLRICRVNVQTGGAALHAYAMGPDACTLTAIAALTLSPDYTCLEHNPGGSPAPSLSTQCSPFIAATATKAHRQAIECIFQVIRVLPMYDCASLQYASMC